MTTSSSPAARLAHPAVAYAIIGGLGLIFAVAQLDASEPWPKIPTECSSNDWFMDHFTSLVREAMESPTAAIEITERSKFGWRWMRGCPRLHQVVAFKFTAHSPVDGSDHSGSGLTVFVYDPASGTAEIMTATEASRVIKEGFEQHSHEEQSASDALSP
jgi:hypothetical protein